jgi:hypothetical protein
LDVVQASEAQATQVKALDLLVRLEALQRDITSTAHLYRVLFQRLATASRDAGGSGIVPPGTEMSSNSGSGEEQHALQTFLRHHFATDALLHEMQARTCSLARLPISTKGTPVTVDAEMSKKMSQQLYSQNVHW